MATVGHWAIAMLAARSQVFPEYSTRKVLLWSIPYSILALLADADVLFTGVSYEHPLHHRGATHSLVVAALAGLLLGVILRFVKYRTWKKTWLLITLVLLSHGVLDSLVVSGCAPALLWPLTAKRYWAPIQFIPQSPIGWGLLSSWGRTVLSTELLMFSPLIFVALVPFRLSTVNKTHLES